MLPRLIDVTAAALLHARHFRLMLSACRCFRLFACHAATFDFRRAAYFATLHAAAAMQSAAMLPERHSTLYC